MNDEDPITALSPGAAALLGAWLAGRDGLHPAAPSPPPAAQTVRYLSGTLPEHQRQVVQAALVRHPAARGELRSIRRILDELQRRPWADVRAGAAGSGLEAEVARAWQALLEERAPAAARGRERWRAAGWAALLREWETGAAEAQAAWAAFLGFGERLAGTWQPGWAAARAGSGVIAVGDGLPPGVEARVLVAELDAGGALHVAVSLERDGAPCVEAAGEAVWLELVALDEPWPLDRAVAEGHRVEWRVAGIGAASGQPMGSFPVESLRISVGARTGAGGPGLRTVAAVVLSAEGETLTGSPALLQLLGEPRCEAGKLQMTLVIPQMTRSAHPGSSLHVGLNVTAGGAQHLGAWTLAEWGDAPRPLSVPAPTADGLLPLSLLRFAVRP